MTPNERGRHCTKCNKTVIDFSLYSDRELIKFFENTNGNVCGRFNNYQLSNTIVATEQNNRSFFYKLFLGSALASWLGFGTNANAQDALQTKSPVQSTSTSHKSNATPENSEQSNLQAHSCFVSGTVRDTLDLTNHGAVAFANLVVTFDTEQVSTGITDVDGKFRLSIPLRYLGKKLSLKCQYLGYNDFTFNFIPKEKMPVKEIHLKRAPVILLGAPMIKRPEENVKPTPGKTTYTKDDIQHMPH